MSKMLNGFYDNPEDPYDKYKNRKGPNNPYEPWPKPHTPDNWQKPVPPKPVTIADLFPRIDRWAIGFDPVFATLKELAKESKTASYPPYNVMKFGDDKFELRIAVAGFAREELNISMKDQTLTVKADSAFKSGQTREVQVGQLLHQGIAERDFTLNFALAEFIEIVSAELKDGMLTIKLELQLPEEKKPKRIDIK
jgi:molecular chaperone IbpA